MNGSPRARLLVFTDLDGTLLAHDDYDWTPAAPALAALRQRGVSLVIASSKTRAEIEAWRERLGMAGPFISENGGALWVPATQAPVAMPDATPVGEYLRVVFGVPYASLRVALADIRTELGVRLNGFGDMNAREIATLTGLTLEEARDAAAREYDEPFVPERALDKDEMARLAALVAARELRLTRGGRFHHLTGANDKGRAARRLIEAWSARGPVEAIGIGDGPNDLELLAACNRAVIVARPDGSHAPELTSALPAAMRTRTPGPHGFGEALIEMLAARP